MPPSTPLHPRCRGGGSRIGSSNPLPPAALAARVATLLLLHLSFAYGVAGDGYLPPICKVVSRGKGRTEVMATLNKTHTRDLPSCCQSFGGITVGFYE